MKRLIVGGLAAAIALTMTACSSGKDRIGTVASPTGAVLDLHTITTRGTGTIKTTPDIATITVGVTTHRSSAADALSTNNAETQTLIDKLRGGGVAAKDIQTADISVNPDYDRDGKPNGYQVSNTVTAILRNLGKAGSVIDGAARAVGNDIRLQGIQFGVGDDTAARAQARADAVRQARAQAEQIAKAANVSVSSVRTISEVSQDTPQPVYRTAASFDAAAVPVNAGQVEIGVAVDVTYDIG